MDHRTRLEFQTNKLGYRFKNVDLLQEALTHTVESTLPGGLSPFPFQNRNFERLMVMGNAVLKFIISQHVIQISDVKCPEGDLTKAKDKLIQVSVQKMVGIKLLEPFSPEAGPYQFIRVASASKLNFDRSKPGAGIPHEKFVQALFGAVYLDAGGIEGNGIDIASKVFAKIWDGVYMQKEGIQACFPKPTKGLKKFWDNNGVDASFMEQIQKAIGVTLSDPNKSYLLAAAVIHKSFYDTVPKGYGIGPDYQRLEFLGDSVLGLIVTEIIWLRNLSYGAGSLTDKITKKIESAELLTIFINLGLRQFVKMKAGGIPGWSNEDDIVESLVGAVFVEGGGPAAMSFIKNNWNFMDEPASDPSLEDLEAKLGYKFKNIQFLIIALTHPTLVPGPALQSDHPIPVDGRPALSYFGKSWIKFHVSEYVLHSCPQNESPVNLESRRNYLCKPETIQAIGRNLQLFKYFREGISAVYCENIMYAICGAIFKDMQEAKIKMSFGAVFYRLWNTFFDSIFLVKRLVDNIPQSWRNAMPGEELETIEDLLRHTFNYPWLIGRGRIGAVDGSRFIGDGFMFSFIGQAVLDLAISVYVSIMCFMELQEGRTLEPQVLHSNTLLDCMEYGLQFYEADYLHEVIHLPKVIENGRSRCASGQDLIKCLLGAVYFDMSGKHADANFSVWKDYFMTTCKFIGGNRDED